MEMPKKEMRYSPAHILRIGMLLFFLCVNGCAMVGPDFVRPKTGVKQEWVEAGNKHIKETQPKYKKWWKVFDDPVLDHLIQTAYERNLPLRIAGVRVFEARALLGIAVGGFYPQAQQGLGGLAYNRWSESSPMATLAETAARNPNFNFQQADIGVGAGWELDFWGKFRRAIQSADANFLSSIAAYDDALVTLTAEVARTYVIIRTFEERLKIAHENVATQKESLRIARARFEAGATGERDVQQALSLLNSTEANIPLIERGIRKAQYALSVLLGMPPGSLGEQLKECREIPRAPAQVAVGIPAELLRRRPDIRNAELQAVSQSALIGVAKADLYPSFSLTGSFGFLSSDVGTSSLGDLFLWKNRAVSIGPSFRWNFFNYGQITNSVRVQDARLQALLINYQDTVLRAQREVEDGLVEFLKACERMKFLERSVEAAKRSAELALTQYREGNADYTSVLIAQQALLNGEDRLAGSQGDVPQGLISVYRALGGGWEIREGNEYIPLEIKKAMESRTDWGKLLSPGNVPSDDRDKQETLVRTPDW